MPNNAPIGLFDSGIGGLSIARQISALIPDEQLIYFADTQYAPYGDKSPSFLKKRTQAICNYLIESGCKLIVIACNTATVTSVAQLRNKFPVPFVGVEPGIKPAIASTKNGNVAIMATVATLASPSFKRLVDIHKKSTNVVLQACPGLADMIEQGHQDSVECRMLLQSFVKPLAEKNIDTVALGCTHYPFIAHLIAPMFSTKVTVIDTSIAVAKQVERILQQHQLFSSKKRGQDKVCIFDITKEKQSHIKQLWHKDIEFLAFELT